MSDLASRFLSKIEMIPFHPCWEWIGSTKNGYGVILEGSRPNRRYLYAHRVSLQLNGVPIPPGMHTDHLCRNTRCVRPEHLQIVSPKENILRGTGQSARNAKKEVCPKGHPLLSKTEQGKRFCLLCRDEYNREYYAKNKKYYQERWLRKKECQK